MNTEYMSFFFAESNGNVIIAICCIVIVTSTATCKFLSDGSLFLIFENLMFLLLFKPSKRGKIVLRLTH